MVTAGRRRAPAISLASAVLPQLGGPTKQRTGSQVARRAGRTMRRRGATGPDPARRRDRADPHRPSAFGVVEANRPVARNRRWRALTGGRAVQAASGPAAARAQPSTVHVVEVGRRVARNCRMRALISGLPAYAASSSRIAASMDPWGAFRSDTAHAPLRQRRGQPVGNAAPPVVSVVVPFSRAGPSSVAVTVPSGPLGGCGCGGQASAAGNVASSFLVVSDTRPGWSDVDGAGEAKRTDVSRAFPPKRQRTRQVREVLEELRPRPIQAAVCWCSSGVMPGDEVGGPLLFR